MKLDVVLRTCDHSAVHNDFRTRYCQKPKAEIIDKCVQSLINSCKNCDHEISLTIYDDHSSELTVANLKNKLSSCNFATKFVSLEDKGYNNSCYIQYSHCKNSKADLVYAVEDDYLHSPSAIQEMIDSYDIFSSKLNKQIILYPFDDPGEYPPQNSCYLVHGSNRHWRTGIFTTCVLMCNPKIFNDHWDLFELVALKYNGNYMQPREEHYEESNTIWKIWMNGDAIRFNPIPSVALHLQFEANRDPFIDWEYWWENYTNEI